MGDPDIQLICGRLRFEQAHGNMVLAALPAVIVVENSKGPLAGRINRIRCELPHGFGRDYGTTSFWSGSCVALFHIEFPDFWDDQRDIVIGVFQKGGGIGSGSWRSEVWAAEFVGAMQKNWE